MSDLDLVTVDDLRKGLAASDRLVTVFAAVTVTHWLDL